MLQILIMVGAKYTQIFLSSPPVKMYLSSDDKTIEVIFSEWS